MRLYDPADAIATRSGPAVTLRPGAQAALAWPIADTQGLPIVELGLELSADHRADGMIYLDFLTWAGAPDVLLGHPGGPGEMWRRAWVDAVDHLESHRDEPYRLIQNAGTGLLIQGTREWQDYRVSAAITPHRVRAAGLGARVQGLRRYYALLLCADGVLRLVKARDGIQTLASTPFAWQADRPYRLSLSVVGEHLRAGVDDRVWLEVADREAALTGGGVALLCEEGRMTAGPVRVQPVSG